MSARGWLLVGMAGVLVAALGAAAIQDRSAASSRAAQQSEATRTIQALQERAQASERMAVEARGHAQEMESRAIAAEARLAKAPKPAPAIPPPTQDAEVAQGLVLAGLGEGLEIRPVQPSGLLPADARMVWTWKEEAMRVPGLELRLGAAEDAAEARRAQAEDLQVALGHSMESIESQKAVVEVSRRAREAAVAQFEREAWKKWGWGAAGVLTGIALGRAVR